MKVKIGNYPGGGLNRKVFVEVSDHDTFNLDITLAEIILPALKKYLEVSDKLINLDEPMFSGGLTKRQAVTECIWVFNEITTYAEEEKIIDLSIGCFDLLQPNLTYLEERKQKALNLFAEIYTSLWN